MKYPELQRIFKSLGYLPQNAKGDHIKFSNGIKSFTVPYRGGKDINRMLTRRLLKEAGYRDWRSV